jgi:hypothetical protein
MSEGALAGVALTAGAGTRLRPLTDLRPKALCPVGGVPLLDLALQRLTASIGSAHLAVNAHHLADQIAAHLAERAPEVHLGVEYPQALGTAGALGALRPWLDGRDALVTNADAFLPEGLAREDGRSFTDDWDAEHCRLACITIPADGGRADFVAGDGRRMRYVGACLLPWRMIRSLAPEPSGLYERLWRDQDAAGRLELWPIAGTALDCGTVSDYLQANLHASGGKSVVGPGAHVEGRLVRSVVWDGAHVGPDEHLVDVVRAAGPGQVLTVGASTSCSLTPTRSSRAACSSRRARRGSPREPRS